MTVFLRLLEAEDKASALSTACVKLRGGKYSDLQIFAVAPNSFDSVPGKPFAYWVSGAIRETFTRLPSFEGAERKVRVGLQTSDDFRFVRLWWETAGPAWFPFAKGGNYSPFYADIYLTVNWRNEGRDLEAFSGSVIRNSGFYFLPGLTWPLRARRFAPQAMPAGCIFSVRGYSAFTARGNESETLALFNSCAFDYLFKTALGRFSFPEFIVGILQIMPWASISADIGKELSSLARRAWSFKRSLDTINETSHAFLLPAALRERLGNYHPPAALAELEHIQAEIDDLAFGLYGFSETDRQAAMSPVGDDTAVQSDDGDEDVTAETPPVDSLLSWTVGIAFGRFDWRLATGERQAPLEPDPFDPLPAKSPGMLPDGAEAFHDHAGILVDDRGHGHDLPRLMEDVLARVDHPVSDDLRRWLRRDFWPFHLKTYSKSSRKAPIYWPLSTASGDYTLWIYYPSLSNQTLYTAVNDLLDPKKRLMASELSALRTKGGDRSRDDEKRLEDLEGQEQELLDMRDTLLDIAPSYRPNQDDGVQITAAPLWPLFRHKPWQKILKDTWAKLEKGDYDWAHLAMAYWPDRVREKCKTDKSLAIAHDLEELYEPPPESAGKGKGRRGKG